MIYNYILVRNISRTIRNEYYIIIYRSRSKFGGLHQKEIVVAERKCQPTEIASYRQLSEIEEKINSTYLDEKIKLPPSVLPLAEK